MSCALTAQKFISVCNSIRSISFHKLIRFTVHMNTAHTHTRTGLCVNPSICISMRLSVCLSANVYVCVCVSFDPCTCLINSIVPIVNIYTTKMCTRLVCLYECVYQHFCQTQSFTWRIHLNIPKSMFHENCYVFCKWNVFFCISMLYE